MTRPLRIEFAGAVYHITSRGNAKQAIFLNEKDFADFLSVLCSVVKRYHFILHAYCLMNNHYHLLIETPYGNLSRGMRQLNGLYCHLKIKSGLFFNDLKFKSGLTKNGKKDVI